MITRIVKMTFKPDSVDRFIGVFGERKQLIAGFDGCNGVELLRDINSPNIFFTYSKWNTPEHLENYRVSELFITTWAMVKPHFADKPEAWSVESI